MARNALCTMSGNALRKAAKGCKKASYSFPSLRSQIGQGLSAKTLSRGSLELQSVHQSCQSSFEHQPRNQGFATGHALAAVLGHADFQPRNAHSNMSYLTLLAELVHASVFPARSSHSPRKIQRKDLQPMS